MGNYILICPGFCRSNVSNRLGPPLEANRRKIMIFAIIVNKVRYWLLIVGGICLILHLGIQPVIAGEKEEGQSGWLQEFGLLTGYGKASIHGQDYELIPFMPRWGFDFKPVVEKIGVKPPGVLEFIIEPLANLVVSPENNAEVGFSLLLKHGLKFKQHFLVFLEGGLGMVYMTQHTVEQGTQYNFLSQGGAGLQYFLTPKLALTGSYRFRHLSNAGISSRNSGINTHMFLTGFSFFYQ